MTTGPGMGIAAPEQIAFAKTSSLWSGKRFYIAALLFLNLFINFMHRINLSVAAPAIARDFGWDAGKMGLLFSSYQWTYCLFLGIHRQVDGLFRPRVLPGGISFIRCSPNLLYHDTPAAQLRRKHMN